MSSDGSALFRAEAVAQRTDRLHGSVSVATPVAWQAIGILMFAILAAVVAFLATATYARVATVTGTMTLDKGVAAILPSRTGVVAAVVVSDGQRVVAGQPLVRIRSEEGLTDGDTAPERIRRALDDQDATLAAQGGSVLEAADAEAQRLREQGTGLAAEVASLDGQIADQRRLVDAAGADYDSAAGISASGFISRRDLEARQTTLISRRQQLAQLGQLRASKVATIAEGRRAMAQSRALAQAQLAGSLSQRASLAQRRAEVELSRGYTIMSPVTGVVTAMTARPGQPAGAERQLMLVVPAGARPRAELHVPTSAAGFIRAGQEVRLSVDAFPYQQFGTVVGRVSDVSAATVAKDGPGGPVPVYLVTASLPRPWIVAFGRRQPFVPGMTLTARIVTEERSLLRWLFEPIFAVRNR